MLNDRADHAGRGQQQIRRLRDNRLRLGIRLFAWLGFLAGVFQQAGHIHRRYRRAGLFNAQLTGGRLDSRAEIIVVLQDQKQIKRIMGMAIIQHVAGVMRKTLAGILEHHHPGNPGTGRR